MPIASLLQWVPMDLMVSYKSVYYYCYYYCYYYYYKHEIIWTYYWHKLQFYHSISAYKQLKCVLGSHFSHHKQLTTINYVHIWPTG